MSAGDGSIRAALTALVEQWRQAAIDTPQNKPAGYAVYEACATELSALLDRLEPPPHVHRWDTEGRDQDGDVNWCETCGALWHGDGTITLPSLTEAPASPPPPHRPEPISLTGADRLQAIDRDPIVLAADAAKAACILRIQRAIDATKQHHAMPLNAEECITILEHMAWDKDFPVAEAPASPPPPERFEANDCDFAKARHIDPAPSQEP